MAKKKPHLEYCDYSKTIRQMPENFIVAQQEDENTNTPYWVCIPDLAVDIDLSTKVFQALLDFGCKYGSGLNLLERVTYMKHKNLSIQYNNLEEKIKEALKSEISNSKIKSKHTNSNSIKVSVFDYVELVIIDSKLTFLDHDGLHYSLFNECTIVDLINILNKLQQE